MNKVVDVISYTVLVALIYAAAKPSPPRIAVIYVVPDPSPPLKYLP